METKELKITIPEGYEIDKENSTFEKIMFKKKEDAKPRSWEEYCNNFKGRFYYIKDDDKCGVGTSFTSVGINSEYKNTLPSKELAEAFLAMMQLMSLRQEWIGDWKPNWDNLTSVKWIIIYSHSQQRWETFPTYDSTRALSFPTKEIATDFMNCFKDLLDIANPLI